MARVRAGDAASENELHGRHIENAQRVARLVASSAEQADDLAEEAFNVVLAQLREGRDPGGEFAPYLRTMVRRLAVDRYRAGTATGLDHGGGPDDLGDLRTAHPMVRQAYETLPPRWQQVLWRSDVQGETPGALAAAFETTPDAAAALAHRAREGLRRAYLGLHVTYAGTEVCKAIAPKLSALARGVLDADDRRAVEGHLAECAACRDRYEEMLLLASDLPGVLTDALIGMTAPSKAGEAATVPFVPAAPAVAAAAASGAAGARSVPGRRAPRRRVSASSGVMVGTLVAATVAVLAFALVVANIGDPADKTAAPPPAAGGASPSDESARVSLETATPSPATPEPDSESDPSPDLDGASTQGTGPEAERGTTAESAGAGSTRTDTTESAEQDDAPADEGDAPEQDEGRASEQDEGRVSEQDEAPAGEGQANQEPEPRQDTPDETASASAPPSESRTPDAAALEASLQWDDAPGWWCEAVPWWPDCSDGSDRDRRGESARDGGGPPDGVPPGISRNALCEWLPDLPPCSSGERDRQRGGPGR